MILFYEEFFFGDIGVLESETNCPLARVKIDSREKITDISLSCPLECSISDFMKSHKDNLIKVQKGIEEIKHLQLVVAILRRVNKNPGECDEDVCRNLADVIIVLEAPEDFLVCSNNVRDFEPICNALEKKFLPVRY